MPTLQELTDLFDVLPELPTPLPRQRRPIPGITNPAIPSPAINEDAATTQTLNAANQLPPSLFHRLLPWVFPRPAVPQPLIPVRRPNPFMALKAGKKMIVIAVVDSGSVGFFRFSQGAFTEWPMM
jgi:tRNA-splicing endonuclease subunit Sen54